MFQDNFQENYNIRQLLVLKIITELESIRSKLVFQKLIFLLQGICKKGLDYEYMGDKLGPFSGELALDIHQFEKDGIIEIVNNLQETVRIKDEDLALRILRNNRNILQENKFETRTLHRILDMFEELQTERNIELAGTIYYLYYYEKCQLIPQLIYQIIQWKGPKFNSNEIRHVFNILIEFHFISQKPSENLHESHEFPLLEIFNRFHAFTRRLLERHAQRPSIQMNDEYDVQDLLYCLLAIEFNSIQKEEYGPQYAGKRPRIDFFLRSEGVAIEVKFVKDKSSIAKIREGIILDREYYSKKETLKDLWFFIYDPRSIITDRITFIEDLEGNRPNYFRLIKVIIKPDL